MTLCQFSELGSQPQCMVAWLPHLGGRLHNNHHAKPGRRDFGGHRWWGLDAGAWIVRLTTLGMPKPMAATVSRRAARP